MQGRAGVDRLTIRFLTGSNRFKPEMWQEEIWRNRKIRSFSEFIHAYWEDSDSILFRIGSRGATTTFW